MKIRDVKAMVLTTGSVFVRVETDLDGLVGWGECSPMNGEVLAHFVNTALRPRLLGEDPREVDRLWSDPVRWWEMAILNTARMGWFSSDRTIRQYADDIWRITL